MWVTQREYLILVLNDTIYSKIKIKKILEHKYIRKLSLALSKVQDFLAFISAIFYILADLDRVQNK